MASKQQSTLVGDPYALPDAETLKSALSLPIQDKNGAETTLNRVIEQSDSQLHLVVFIRHFFCGNCEEYVGALTRAFTSPETHKPSFSLSIIGCGLPTAIDDYHKRTGCPFPIYTDSEHKIYTMLGMVQNMSLGDKKPEYIQNSLAKTSVSGAWNAISNGFSGMSGKKGGHFSQNGGELVFLNGELKWFHRMQHTRDHAEVAELERALVTVDEGVKKGSGA